MRASRPSRPGLGGAILLLLLLPALGLGQEMRTDLSRKDGSADLSSDFLLGLEVSQQIARHYGLVETDSLIRRVNEIGYRVAMVSGRPDITFTFQILDMDAPNAMALPGGWIFVTRGILDVGLTDAELAHLLGHEISHVTRSHFSRQGRLDGLLSLLQTAVMVAVTMGASGSSSSPVIEDPRAERYPQSSAEAAMTGTAIFGSLFHELLIRGYGRKLEMESDEDGRRLAALAGYPREAGESLLQKLHNHIYEDREFGYWRTHPFFVDRVAVARAAPRGSDFPPGEEEVAAHRVQTHLRLAEAASAFRNERLADYLYELSLRAQPREGTSLRVHAELLRFRQERMRRVPEILRRYGPLRADYDSLLSRGRRAAEDPALIAETAARRDSTEACRAALLPRYTQTLEEPNPNTAVLHAFLENFPDHPSADAVRLRLARAYRLSSRHDLALETLGDLVLRAEIPPRDGTGGAQAPHDSTDVDRARAEILRTLPLVSGPEVCQRLLDGLEDPILAKALEDRLAAIADSLTAIETAGRFVQSYPSSPAAERFRSRLASLAEIEYKKGRLHEGLGDEQSALGAYNRISLLAPGTPAAEQARMGIVRIQALSTSEPHR